MTKKTGLLEEHVPKKERDGRCKEQARMGYVNPKQRQLQYTA
jgi:hypothetical protein